jgi:hypothetical protein
MMLLMLVAGHHGYVVQFRLHQSQFCSACNTAHRTTRYQPMAAHHTIARVSVGGRELGPPNENLSVFQHRVSMSNIRMERYRKF